MLSIARRFQVKSLLYVLLGLVVHSGTMEHFEPSYLFPVFSLSTQAQVLLTQYENSHLNGWKTRRLKLLKQLNVGSIAEKTFPDYKLTANDYQCACNDAVVLQAWIAYLPARMRDVHINRFFYEICFTNKLPVLRLLEEWGLRVDRLEPKLIARLENHARAHDYKELAVYLGSLLK